MANIVTLTGEPLDATPEPDPQMVEIAKEMLARVESGELVGFAAVGVSEDGGTWMFRGGHQDAALVGRLEHIKARIIANWDGDA